MGELVRKIHTLISSVANIQHREFSIYYENNLKLNEVPKLLENIVNSENYSHVWVICMHRLLLCIIQLALSTWSTLLIMTSCTSPIPIYRYKFVVIRLVSTSNIDWTCHYFHVQLVTVLVLTYDQICHKYYKSFYVS